MNNQEAIEVISNNISEEDAQIVLDIAKEAIQRMNLPPSMTNDEFAALSNEERIIELRTPKVNAHKVTDDLSCIFIRFVGDQTPLAEVVFFPIEAVHSFLDTGRNYFNTPGTTLTPEEIENLAFRKAVNMFLIMMRNLYPRVMATMQSITDETINEWYRQENEQYREYQGRQGIYVPTNEPIVMKSRQNIFNEHNKDIKNIWGEEKKRFENYQKLRFAEEYEKLYKHWDTISLLYRSNKDFLGYAKMEGFQDTPDDLLDSLKGSHHRGISLKALEHAARRVDIMNLENDKEEILEMRKNGIRASGFSETTLHKYLEEGKAIIEIHKSPQLSQGTPPEVKQLAE